MRDREGEGNDGEASGGISKAWGGRRRAHDEGEQAAVLSANGVVAQGWKSGGGEESWVRGEPRRGGAFYRGSGWPARRGATSVLMAAIEGTNY
jgi:hypothetical protein